MTENKKIEYVEPKMEELGRFESMTQSTNTGFDFDDNFQGVVAPNILS